MKQRMITVVVGITLLIIVLLFYKTIVLNIGVALVGVIAVQEIFAASGGARNKGLLSVCTAFAALFPFVGYVPMKEAAALAFFAFFFLVFLVMLARHETIRLEQMAVCFMITLMTTAALTGIPYLRDELAAVSLTELPLLYLCLVFAGAWMTDGGGYIFGRQFGRHHMAPKISPKKTVEGAVGGVLSTVAVACLLLFAYSAYLSARGVAAHFSYPSVILLSLVCGVVSIIGDLSASVIKRQYGIKDFGHILPGHGGILDRFDSILFVVPVVVAWIRIFPVVTP